MSISFFEVLKKEKPLSVAGAINPFSALLAKKTGIKALYISGAGVANASFGIYFPKFLGTIYEHLSAPVSFLEITIGYVGAAATKSFIIGIILSSNSDI